ncbi:MAG: glycoside hydrolase family 88 protein [Bacteroidales bacterium]|nr:glycoside hydrolase family 88 protein [Bacteroidales bacterium]
MKSVLSIIMFIAIAVQEANAQQYTLTETPQSLIQNIADAPTESSAIICGSIGEITKPKVQIAETYAWKDTDSTLNSVAENAVNKVIERIIESTNFNLIQKPQKPSETVQAVNFSNHLTINTDGFAYALSFINCSVDGIYTFGYGSECVSEVFINTEKVFSSGKPGNLWFTEFAYDRYKFPYMFTAYCHKGNNPVLIKLSGKGDLKFYLATIENDGQINPDAHFMLEPGFGVTNSNWLVCRTMDSASVLPQFPGNNRLPVFTSNNCFTNWDVPEVPLVASLAANSGSPFKKHSYVEWHYSNGATLWSILNYASLTQNKNFENFVSECCNFNLQNFDNFKFQYFGLNEIHGYNHRMYRMHMLDDASAPALPYLKLFAQGKLAGAGQLLKNAEEYVVNWQYRLVDGTFCRPEPWAATIWADDLFMAAPFLMMLGESGGDSGYFDEAAFQVISYYKYLFDTKSGLCRHGWVNSPEKDSIPFWSRANGWMIWATSEVLLKLPETHKDYNTIKALFKTHVDGLLAWQNQEGFLHQLINDSATFAETSSTAMLTIALARGVNRGWLAEEYTKAALKGWNAVLTRIEPDGTVKDICEGTSINTKSKYYVERKTMDHDPRGLGAVITAGLEISKLNTRH